MTVGVYGFLEVANHEGRDFISERAWRAKRGALLEEVAHDGLPIKIINPRTISMKSIQLTIDSGSFHRSSVVSRRVTKSQRVSRSTHLSLKKKVNDASLENQEQPDIYFNNSKRKSYFRSVIDNYFLPHDHQSFQRLQEGEHAINIGPPLLSRDCMSSESSRVKARDSLTLSRLKLKSRVSLADFSSMVEVNSLPIIEEGMKGHKRPASEHKTSSFLSIEKDKNLQESLFYQSNNSFMESSQADHLNSFKFIAIRKDGKRFGRAKVFTSSHNEQLQRQIAAKKVGMEVLWKASSGTNSLEYPPYKTLRQLCYSKVEEKSGEEPINLLYPNPYYFSLFANQCEELIDIVVSLARGVAQGQGLVANNQIRIGNVVKVGEKRFVLADWGCASIREGFTVQGRTFNKDFGALCKEDTKWLLSPQFLAPELLKSTQTCYFQHLWRQKGGVGSCDIWSIGCLLFQLITLVPLGCVNYCVVKGRQKKRGVFGNKVQTADKILSKQRNFKSYAEMRVHKQVKVIDKLMQILPRMLEENPEVRISAQDILAKLA